MIRTREEIIAAGWQSVGGFVDVLIEFETFQKIDTAGLMARASVLIRDNVTGMTTVIPLKMRFGRRSR